MNNSYVPAGTLVNCTHMTAPKPQELQAIRGTQSVSHTKGILLTIEDKKISNTFICKNPKKFWNGIMMMCAGIAVGALALAVVVGTGGAAAPVVVGLVCTGIGSTFAAAGAGVVGQFASHDCDPTLESEWILEHTSVKFNSSFALLQQSILKCQNGGMVTIFMDEVVAIDAAKEYARNNNQEALTHTKYQFFEGIFSGATSLTPIGIIIGFVTGMMGYEGYYFEENETEKEQTKMLQNIIEGKDNEHNEGSIIEPSLIGEISQDIIVGTVVDAAQDAYKRKSLKAIPKTIKNIDIKENSIGIIGTIVNHILDNISNDIEEQIYEKNIDNFREFLKILNNTKGINVISKEN